MLVRTERAQRGRFSRVHREVFPSRWLCVCAVLSLVAAGCTAPVRTTGGGGNGRGNGGCPAGFEADGGLCLIGPPVCPPGHVGDGGVCLCPADLIDDAGVCHCPGGRAWTGLVCLQGEARVSLVDAAYTLTPYDALYLPRLAANLAVS